MIRGGVLAAVAALALAAGPASAQTPPIDDGTTVGGEVPSYLGLSLTQPSGFASFKKSGSYLLSFTATLTSTEEVTQLSLADGDAISGAGRGHLSGGGKRLPDPLEARAGSAAFQPLDAAIDPLLQRWSGGPVTNKAAKVTLRQKVRANASGPYHKLLFVTASTEMP
jgi:hypothetical protein